MVMLGLETVRDVFQEETEKYLEKLKSHTRSSDSAWEQAQCDSITRLASNMTDSIVRRVVENKDAWMQPLDAGNDAQDEDKAPHDEVRARCQELRTQLAQRLAEERRIKGEIARRLKDESDKQLNLLEMKFARVRERAARPPNCCERSDTRCQDSAEATKIHEDYIACVARVRRNVGISKEAMSTLNKKRSELERISQQQLLSHSNRSRHAATCLDLDCDEEMGSDDADEEIYNLRRLVEAEEGARVKGNRHSQRY